MGFLWWMMMGGIPLEVERVALYKAPSYFAPTQKILHRGQEVKILTRREGWAHVVLVGTPDTGWIPIQAVERPLWNFPLPTNRQQDKEEAVALATKGLTEAVDQSARRHSQSNQALKKLKRIATEAEKRLVTFVQSGNLHPEGAP